MKWPLPMQLKEEGVIPSQEQEGNKYAEKETEGFDSKPNPHVMFVGTNV